MLALNSALEPVRRLMQPKKWEKEIEENNSTLLFIREIEGKMLNRSNDDMHLGTTLNLDEDSLKVLKYYIPEVYDRAISNSGMAL
jgi:hypothetical protein